MESDPLSKIEAVLQTLDLVERKSEVYKTAVLSHVDELEAELAKARTQLQEAPTPEQRAAVLGVLTEAIRVKKPLTSMPYLKWVIGRFNKKNPCFKQQIKYLQNKDTLTFVI